MTKEKEGDGVEEDKEREVPFGRSYDSIREGLVAAEVGEVEGDGSRGGEDELEVRGNGDVGMVEEKIEGKAARKKISLAENKVGLAKNKGSTAIGNSRRSERNFENPTQVEDSAARKKIRSAGNKISLAKNKGSAAIGDIRQSERNFENPTRVEDSAARKKISLAGNKVGLAKNKGSTAIGNIRRSDRNFENPTQVIEATLLELVNESSSDAARVSAAKALMELVKYMNGENDQSARKHEEAEKNAAVAEARTLLAEFAELKFRLGSSDVAAAAGDEQPHEVVDKRKSKPDNAAVG